MAERLYYWNNPDFNEVLIFSGLQARSFRDGKKAKNLINILRIQLKRIRCANWPYRVPIMIAIVISGPSEIYSRRDVDNMCKVILDAGNKIIYADDSLIKILIVQKELWKKSIHGFHIGIRVPDKKDKYFPAIIISSNKEPNMNQNNITKPITFSFKTEGDKISIVQIL